MLIFRAWATCDKPQVWKQHALNKTPRCWSWKLKNVVKAPKIEQRGKTLGDQTFFNFKNNRHKHRSYDFHNVGEEPHCSSRLDKSNSCASQSWPIVCFQFLSVFSLLYLFYMISSVWTDICFSGKMYVTFPGCGFFHAFSGFLLSHNAFHSVYIRNAFPQCELFDDSLGFLLG